MLFEMGSVAKYYEAALVLKIPENHHMSLDDPLSEYLPEYGTSIAYSGNTGESPSALAFQLMDAIWAALSDVVI